MPNHFWITTKRIRFIISQGHPLVRLEPVNGGYQACIDPYQQIQPTIHNRSSAELTVSITHLPSGTKSCRTIHAHRDFVFNGFARRLTEEVICIGTGNQLQIEVRRGDQSLELITIELAPQTV